MLLPFKIEVPSVSVCWILKDVIDSNRFPGLSDVQFKDIKDMRDYYDKLDQLTVKQIFEATPGNESVLHDSRGCSIRLPGQFASKYPQSTAKECYSMFSIRKFILRDYMCYQFKPTIIAEGIILDIAEYALSPQKPGLIYQLLLSNTLFGDVTYYTAIAQHDKNSVGHDSGFQIMKFYEREKNASNSYLSMEVSYAIVDEEQLKYPYDTACLECETSCVDWYLENSKRTVIKELDRVPTMLPVFESSLEKRLLTAKHLRLDAFRTKFADIFREVSDGALSSCHTKFYITKSNAAYGSVVKVNVYWPVNLQVNMKKVPLQQPIDYVLYVCSSVGTWLGLSILSIGQGLSETFVRYYGHKKVAPKINDVNTHSKVLATHYHFLRVFGRDIKELKREMYNLKNGKLTLREVTSTI